MLRPASLTEFAAMKKNIPAPMCRSLSVLLFVCGLSCSVDLAAKEIDRSGYSPDCRIQVTADDSRLIARWPIAAGQEGYLELDLSGRQPLVRELGLTAAGAPATQKLLENADPAFYLTVGSRNVPEGKPAWQKWQVFFDSPAQRPHRAFVSQLNPTLVRITGTAERARISIAELTVGDFRGTLDFEFFAGCDLLQIQAVISTTDDDRAIVYDAALLGDPADGAHFVWRDTRGELRREAVAVSSDDRALTVRGRTLVLENPHGSLALFPPPHQFFFPRDLTDNLRYVWFGRQHLNLSPRFGFGIRNDKTGGGGFVPWFNAPPGTAQRLSMFLLLSGGNGQQAWQQAANYTRGDRFAALDGFRTFTSHWHMAVAVTEMQNIQAGRGGRIPELVQIFKDLGVEIVHLGEFHGDGHQKDAGPLRLEELAMMFQECRRLSDDQLLLLPGEEVNTFLGLQEPGKHPGHWMSFFPKPVYWIMQRTADQPFVEEHPQYGTVYRVGSREDMMRRLVEQQGLVWAAHPRIKASSWTPDIFRQEDFFLADYWLGGAWKAMPADLSSPRLGQRALDLLDDMANWGCRKYVLGEVDVFKIDATHELFGHMNINYLALEQLPRFDDGWATVLDGLRGGKFFTTTGEVLLPRFEIEGRSSGDTLKLGDPNGARLRCELQWTFPLAFAEIVSGDGVQVYRQPISLAHTGPMGQEVLEHRIDLRGRKWVRFEVWDVAANGAFTQPVWIE
jgi:hypothetical protein